MNAGGRAYARLLGDGWRFPNGSSYWSAVVDQGLAIRKASALGALPLLVNRAGGNWVVQSKCPLVIGGAW